MSPLDVLEGPRARQLSRRVPIPWEVGGLRAAPGGRIWCVGTPDDEAIPSDSRLLVSLTSGSVLDHIIPVVEGGDDDPDNLRAAHRWCNQARQRGFATDSEIREVAWAKFATKA